MEQARQPSFYTDFGVADSPEGRFEMVAAHVWLLLDRLKAEGPETAKLSEKLMETFFDDMDASLREMGVGDLSVGKKIRALAENFIGRAGAYEKALKQRESGDDALADALARNILESDAPERGRAMAAYVRKAAAHLAAQPASRLANGVATFPAAQTGEN